LNPGNNIAAWNGTNWNSLGDASMGFGVNGINASVVRMIVHGDYLYVCGKFSEAGGKPATHIARWDGTNWCALATEFPPDHSVTSLAFYGDTLFAVGTFMNHAGDTTIRYAAKLPNPDSQVLNCTTVGTAETDLINKTTFYPNPTNSKILINSSILFKTINLYSIHGKLILSTQFNKILDIENVVSGVYLIELINDDLTVNRKIIKF
jgi:hypothetical protein